MITNAMIENWFQYHTPGPEQIEVYRLIRQTARSLAFVIVNNTPASADQTAALRKLRECVMTANAAVACSGE